MLIFIPFVYFVRCFFIFFCLHRTVAWTQVGSVPPKNATNNKTIYFTKNNTTLWSAAHCRPCGVLRFFIMRTFNADLTKNSYKSQFINEICKLIYQTNDCDISKSLKEVPKFKEYFDDFIRNFYEVIDECPLIALDELNKSSFDDLGFDNEDDRLQYIENAKKACVLYYNS